MCEVRHRYIAQEQDTTLSRPAVEVPSKGKLQLQSLKVTLKVFSMLYLACQSRDGDVDQFFCHEKHACPPCLSLGGKLRHGTNADLMPYLEGETTASEESPVVDAIFLDGTAVVQMLNTGTAKTFWCIRAGVCALCISTT